MSLAWAVVDFILFAILIGAAVRYFNADPPWHSVMFLALAGMFFALGVWQLGNAIITTAYERHAALQHAMENGTP